MEAGPKHPWWPPVAAACGQNCLVAPLLRADHRRLPERCNVTSASTVSSTEFFFVSPLFLIVREFGLTQKSQHDKHVSAMLPFSLIFSLFFSAHPTATLLDYSLLLPMTMFVSSPGNVQKKKRKKRSCSFTSFPCDFFVVTILLYDGFHAGTEHYFAILPLGNGNSK